MGCILKMGDLSVYGDYILSGSKGVIMTSFFDRAKNKVKACSAMMGIEKMSFNFQRFSTKGNSYKIIFKPIILGRDKFVYTTCINREVGVHLLLTTQDDEEEDVYAFLMEHYELPLLKEWSREILSRCLSTKHVLSETDISGNRTRMISIHGKKYALSDLRVYDFENLSEDVLEEMVSKLLREQKIFFSSRPSKKLAFDNFNNYISRYGSLLADNLRNSMNSLTELNGVVSCFAAKSKRMYPQQAACVNGILGLMESGSRYGLMIEGMGCGKTLQAAAAVDASMNMKWLKTHPGKTLRDLYLAEDQPKYRVIVMVPGHLLDKWRDEILGEVPGAQVTVVKNLSCLIELRKRGKKPSGREWYIVSKDTAKLGAMESPIPSVVGKEYITENYCVSCMEACGKITYPIRHGRKSICPVCNGKDFTKIQVIEAGKQYGLLCPHCGKLLIKGLGRKEYDVDDFSLNVLKPADFASRTIKNSTCHVCGGVLWGVNSKPVSNVPVKMKSPAWYKIAHYKNHAKKTKISAYVLRGHEQEYLDERGIEEYSLCSNEYGPRKVALSRYVKKYLQGFFDVCILDEVHKYEGGGTAQSNAAQTFVNASRFTLGLSGTICNGKADSFFYLLYMLDPRRMIDKGYGYEDVLKFSEKYGSTETIYEAVESDGEYNLSSRGRIIRSPRVKPGISPLLFLDFLLDKGIFLDLSDLSKYLPSLTERVIPVAMPDKIQRAYDKTIKQLKGLIRSPEGGRGVLSALLTFGLSYPDKPYGRLPIMSGKIKDYMLAQPENFEEFSQAECLLQKEKKLVELINQEKEEKRNCFVYCMYTGNAETNILERIRTVIIQNCNFKSDEVTTVNATSPCADKRESWVHKKAAEGTKIFICNYKLVETGLDFCFYHEGVFYNYPTIFYLQISHELSFMWQASRRGYRLNQPVECRIFYLVYERTAQMAALQLMAEKQIAVSAIQGKFSVDGLASMAKGIDPAIKIAQKLSENDIADVNSLKEMFETIQSTDEDERYDKFEKAILFSELMEGARYNEYPIEQEQGEVSMFNIISMISDENKDCTVDSQRDNVEFADVFGIFNLSYSILDENENPRNNGCKTKRNSRKKKVYDMEQTVFDLF